MLTTKRTLHQKVGMPYLLLLDEDGIVQYRIDKAERGNARKVKFDILKVDGTGAYCRKAIVEHVNTVTGIKAAKAVADMLSRRALLKDDYRGTKEGLVDAWLNEHPHVYHIDFEVPDDTPDRNVVLIARGLFWEDAWTMDDTVSTVVSDLTPEDKRPLGENRAGGVKEIDLWDDKVNW